MARDVYIKALLAALDTFEHTLDLDERRQTAHA
jgi:hypothetical protein